ncbi:MAG: glycosyltransferase family 2 protein [Paracoccaceae bacterium]
MSDPRLRLHAPLPARRDSVPRRPIGRHLIEQSVLTPRGLLHALLLQHDWDAPLGEILVAEGLATEAQVLEAVARQSGLHVVDLDEAPPAVGLTDLLPAPVWLRHRIIPWMQMGQTLVVATPWPDEVNRIREMLPDSIDTVLTIVVSEAQVMAGLAQACGSDLAKRAETRVDTQYSCRTWADRRDPFFYRTFAVLGTLLMVVGAFPAFALQVVCVLAMLTLIPVVALKLTAFFGQLFGRMHDPPPINTQPSDTRLPRISVIVPLFHETEIADALIQRLRRVQYPKALLDVVLVLEEKDEVTRATLEDTDLPHWMRAISVPDSGPLTTKPRALNYALEFCRGDIIGVWDAEDAPAPAQLHQVAARFAEAPSDVACLQGVLDYYNPRSNWLSRCFTIEYAGWWRVLLPGVQRLGMVLPLGGTTLFFRRDILESLGAWDAHNVTEDADLGIRLAREGYRTELIASVTHEEANCRLLPWIKQRSRWLKGFLVTWLVHMRRPVLLLSQLGWWRVLGIHALMAGTVAQFVLAPVLWTLWVIPLGLPHPLADVAGSWLIWALCGLCVLGELGNLAIGATGVSGRAHRFLLPWVITMPIYFSLGTAAAAKAIWELAICPYFWDKTQHGIAAPDIACDLKAARPFDPHPDEDGS